MLKKLFCGVRMTWARLILFALVSGLITGLIALLVPEGNSIRQIAVTFEVWIVLAIIVVVNCEKPLEAACKVFVYFLISQPLVYLVQVPFNSLGFGLFRYYYPYWFYWTIATFPGGWIAWHVRRNDVLAAIILSVATAALLFLGAGYLRTLLRTPPKYLIAALFCLGSVPVLILCVLRARTPRLVAGGIAVLALCAALLLTFGGVAGRVPESGVSFGVDEEKYPVTEEWSVRLAEPDNGSVSLYIGDDVIGSRVTVRIKDPDRSADVILVDPEGNEYRLKATVIRDGNGDPTYLYEQ